MGYEFINKILKNGIEKTKIKDLVYGQQFLNTIYSEYDLYFISDEKREYIVDLAKENLDFIKTKIECLENKEKDDEWALIWLMELKLLISEELEKRYDLVDHQMGLIK
jgi:hypothetical protein